MSYSVLNSIVFVEFEYTVGSAYILYIHVWLNFDTVACSKTLGKHSENVLKGRDTVTCTCTTFIDCVYCIVMQCT